ncbi:hypothetical protein F0562_008690 [Nyssa sinensis]|uniref:Uncharacterized protein n=1 Tax=Nyssa sinensis TaxID=561372 RepID=A0A5J5AD15_9ASTE|nr:hypothetical protein F0562_008690 [Nyssa sinensis]
MGCCQANGSSSCCQDPLLPEETGNTDPNEREAKLTAEKKTSKKQMSRNNSGRGAGCKVCAMPTWFESWEREDLYATLAVIGAAASVAFAYSCYKQLRFYLGKPFGENCKSRIGSVDLYEKWDILGVLGLS